MMTCREILDYLVDYLDGTLSPAQRALFEEHLAICPGCVDYLHSYHHTVKCARAAANVRMDLPEEVVQAVLKIRV